MNKQRKLVKKAESEKQKTRGKPTKQAQLKSSERKKNLANMGRPISYRWEGIPSGRWEEHSH